VSAEPLFTTDGDTFVPSGPARGPWDPNALHGGAPAALLARAVEQVPTLAPMRVTRMTFDLVGAVPMAPLTIETSVLREGRRLQVVEAELKAGGEVAMRTRALRIRTENTAGIATDTLPPPGPGPADSTPLEAEGYSAENFATVAMELRFSSGAFGEIGPASAWFRLRMPVVDDELPSPLQRVMVAADFPNGISRVLDFETHLFINPDLTVHLSREPRGEWIQVAAVSAIEPDGIGLATATLCDEYGPIGVAAQSLFVSAR
jgi:Thioesterase-like superfamily